MNIGERIKTMRLKNNLTQDELALRINTTKQTIHKYENGIITNIPSSKIEAIASTLNTTPEYLMGWNITEPNVSNDNIEFPVIGDVAAGFDKIAIEEWIGDKIEVPRSFLKGDNEEDYFVLKVIGNSMYPLYIEGDKVLIKKQNAVDYNGQVAVAIYDDCGTIKKIEYKKDSVSLVPINPQYQPETFKGADCERIRILGIPKLLVRDIDE